MLPPSIDSSPPAPPVPPSARTWSGGTLVYSFGGLVALFFLLLIGDFAWSMRDRSIGQMAQWYLSELKVPSFLFAVLISSLPSAIALVFSPIISVRSDRHRGKWGRRIPYLLITTPFAALSIIGLGFSPAIARWVHGTFASGRPVGQWLHGILGEGGGASWLLQQTQNETLISLLCFVVFWTSFEFATITVHSVFYGLVNDVVPPLLLGRFYGLFRAISLIDGMIFNQLVFGHVADHYTFILVVIGLFYGLGFMGVCFAVKEGEYPPPPPPASRGRKRFGGFLAEVKKYFQECFSNPYYVAVFFLITVGNLTFIPVNTFLMPFSKSLHVDPRIYGHYFFIVFATSLCLAFPLGWLVDRFHPLRMVIGSLGAYVLVTLWSSFFVVSEPTFLLAMLAHGVISGCYFTSMASLSSRLFPRSRFAQFASAVVILSSIAGIVVGPLLGLLIDATGKAYRCIYIGGFLFALLALFFSWRVYLGFVRYGGPKNYVAPE